MPVVSDKRQIEFLNLIAERKFWCHTGRFDMAFYRALCRSLCRALLPGALSGSMPAAVSSASNMIDNYEFDSHYVVLWRHTLLNEPSSCLKGALESLNLSNEKLMKYELMKYLSEREKTAGSQHHYMFTRKANFSSSKWYRFCSFQHFDTFRPSSDSRIQVPLRVVPASDLLRVVHTSCGSCPANLHLPSFAILQWGFLICVYKWLVTSHL